MHRIKQRKGHCFFQDFSDDVDDQDDDLIAPIAFKISVLKCNHPKQAHLLKPVRRFVRFFQRNRKSTRLRVFKAEKGDLKKVGKGRSASTYLFLVVNDSSIHASSSSTEILPSVHSSRLVMAEYFHCLNFSSVI